LGASSFSYQNRGARVMVFHGRICSLEEGSGGSRVRRISRDGGGGGTPYLAASLPWPELHRWKRSSLRPWVKAYLVAIAAAWEDRGRGSRGRRGVGYEAS